VSLYSKNIENILDDYDADFGLYKAYVDRLLIILNEVFNRTTIPINSITGHLMSRGALRNKLLAKGAVYNTLDDIDNLISLKVVTYFHDDINFSISLISKEFLLEEYPLTEMEEATQNHFGILMKRLSLMLPEEKYRQVEYERFASMRTELKVRSALQNSWFKVKDIFDDIAKKNHITSTEINQLAQVSYLLKMADAELCRIKTALINKNRDDETEPAPENNQNQPRQESHPQEAKTEQSQREYSSPQEATSEMDIGEYTKFLREIESFVLNDRVVRALDRNIADYYGTRLTYREDFSASLARIFINIHLSSIGSIKVQLDDNRDTINNLMKHIFGDMLETELDDVNRGSSLLVLFYVLIAQTGNIEIIKRQIRDHSALEDISVDEFSNDLLFYYRKSV
jgi:putative GTP pyrophosphokinase